MISSNLMQSIIILCIGICSISIGASLYILSNVGADPYNLFMQGLSNFGQLSIGQFIVITSFLQVIIIFFWDKKYLKIGTIIAVSTLGPMIDFSMYLLEFLFTNEVDYWLKLMSMVVGSIFISLGISIIYCAKIGLIPNDALPVIIASKVSLSFKWVRMGYDLNFLVIGVLLGGVFGIGTIFCALTTGPLITLFLPYLESLRGKYLVD